MSESLSIPVVVPLKETLASLPDPWSYDLIPEIRKEIDANPTQVFVLDDDPTGSQTVRNVSLLTDWSVESIVNEFNTPEEASFLLINSRALTLSEAVDTNRLVGKNLLQASGELGEKFSVISRSDSTLRGYFPEEVEALADSIHEQGIQGFDSLLFVPFFIQGGRYTINDVQYVSDGENLIPAGQTPFAEDTAFGYKASNLKEWMEEKYKGRVSSEDVTSISIEEIREGGPDKVESILTNLEKGRVCIVNAAAMSDLNVLTLAVLRAEAKGKNFLCRTSASFVRSRIGQGSHDMLSKEQIVNSDEGGALILVGSHVPGSTFQLENVLKIPGMVGIELEVESVLAEKPDVVDSIVTKVNDALRNSQDVTVFTSREVVTGSSPEEYLRIGAKVTDAMTEIVKLIDITPRYIISKGGMTSSNVTANGLGMVRAIVPGQIQPGVLVLRLGEETKFPGTHLVLYPGNVGVPDSIADVVRKLSP
ncbi:MAG: four-carbon acid sugar kinase family protein [Chloroflexota bacterium]|nr:four-carbon acid sugar kinase family protein [Chloroflexota bacterium]